jgi:hypothetical protein
MTSIDASQRLAAMLRSQVFAHRQRATGQRRAGDPAESGAAVPADVAAIVAQRIQGIASQDPERKNKALRIFLESVLLHELGPDLVSDPSFPDMVSAVQQQMQSDAQLSAAAAELSELLLAGAIRK